MPFVRREFYYQGRGAGDEDRYSLARDRGTGRVFVFHEWSRRRGQAVAEGTAEIELGAFFTRGGEASDKLRDLIGTLVQE